MKIIPLILSGGSGTRLWPLSNNEHPKQFLRLTSEHSMIQETMLRLNGLNIGEPIVVCGEMHRFLVAQQLEEINVKPKILLEPLPKNTAPAIAVGCCAALEQNEDAVVLVLPSDHVIRNLEVFKKAVETAVELAENGSLVTFGVMPTYPATGYGYIKGGEHLAHHVYSLEKFVEKPSLEIAKKYVLSGKYSWNSGMFVFKASEYLKELTCFNPEMARLSMNAYKNAVKETDFVRLDKKMFEQIKGDSIDYAIMEKTNCGKIVKLNAGWDDVGSWSALYDISTKDSDLNVIEGDVIALNTTASYIKGKTHTIAVIGLDNIVVVDSEDSILIAAKGKLQDVKTIPEIIKTRSIK